MQIKFVVAGVVVLGLVILLILLVGNKKEDDDDGDQEPTPNPVDTKCDSRNFIRKCDCSENYFVGGQHVCVEPSGDPQLQRKRNLCTKYSNQDESSCSKAVGVMAGTCKWTETGCID